VAGVQIGDENTTVTHWGRPVQVRAMAIRNTPSLTVLRCTQWTICDDDQRC